MLPVDVRVVFRRVCFAVALLCLTYGGLVYYGPIGALAAFVLVSAAIIDLERRAD